MKFSSLYHATGPTHCIFFLYRIGFCEIPNSALAVCFPRSYCRPNYDMYLQVASLREYRATQEAGYGGFAGVYRVSVQTTRPHTSALSCGRFPHIKHWNRCPLPVTEVVFLEVAEGRAFRGVLTAHELRTKVIKTSREDSDTNSHRSSSPHSTFESSQMWEDKCCWAAASAGLTA